jgi:hypothetical protein
MTTNIILPNGKGSGWRPGFRDPVNDWKLSRRLGAPKRAAPVNPSLDPRYFPRIRDQGQLGSCGGHSVRNAMAYLLRKRLGEKLEGPWGQTKWDLSPLAAYYFGRLEEGPQWVKQDAGVIILEVVKGARKWGIPTEETWPYDQSKFARKPTKKALETGKWHQASPGTYRCDEDGDRHKTIDRMLQALAAGFPLIYGFVCYDNIQRADDTGILPPPQGSTTGGHAVNSFWADTKARIFWGPNHWGHTWGGRAPPGARHDERGYIGLPFSAVLDGWCDDIWAMDLEETPQ